VHRYGPAQAAVVAGAVPTGNMTIGAVVAKLSWVLADVDAQIEGGELAEESRISEVEIQMRKNEIGEVGAIEVEKPLDSERRSGLGNEEPADA
jgi:hypothetical protein